MALHSGLVWLADGFAKQDKLATPPALDEINGSGDARCPDNRGRKLILRDDSNIEIPQVHTKRTAKSKVASRPQSARVATCNCSSQSHKHKLGVMAPSDKAPRTGAWKSKGHQDSDDRIEPRSAFSPVYGDMPTHPDLRYFDRHSRCHNNPHCAHNLMLSRPRTACAAGRLSLTQCECCGEVTSMMRYRYAPTGSAMTENRNSRNKTFLYPEKLLTYDSYNGRRRPSSAPSRFTHRPTPSHNYVIRGDIPHFCNFVKPCTVYDKATGEKVLQNTDVILDLLSNYDADLSEAQDEKSFPVTDIQDAPPATGDKEPASSVTELEETGGLKSRKDSSSDKVLSTALTRIRSERISTVSFGETKSKRQLNVPRKRPPSQTNLAKKSSSKQKSRAMAKRPPKKKGLFDDDSDPALPTTSAEPPTEPSDAGHEAPAVIEEPVTIVKPPSPPPKAASPEPEANPDVAPQKPRYSRKLGTGGTDEENMVDFDQMVKSPLRMQAWMNGRLALSKRSSRFELPMDMRLLETMTPLEYLGKYCVVTSKRQLLYDKIFAKQKNTTTGKLGFQELQKALSEVLIQSIDKQKMELVLDMLHVDDSVVIDKKLFHGVSAFAERLLYPIFARGDQFSSDTQKENIETADFFALEWKFHGVNVNPKIRRILEAL